MSETVYQVLLTLFGNDPLLVDDAKGWLQQGFQFHPIISNLSFGLAQKYGGPCGILAAVQGFVLLKLLPEHYEFKQEEESKLQAPLKPTEDQRIRALAWALTSILDRTRPTGGKFIIVLGIPETFPIVEKVLEVATFAQTEQLILEYKSYFESDIGVLLFVISLILTRGVDQVGADRDDTSQPLVQRFGHTSQDLVNLCLCGKAVSNVHDGDKVLADDPNPQPDAYALKGIPSEVPVGFLSSLEAMRYSRVGSFYKNPQCPVWVIASPSHYSVLFGLNREIAVRSDKEKLEQSIRETFNSLDHQELGFIPLENASVLIEKLNLDLPKKVSLREKIENNSMEIILWSDFWKMYQDVSSEPEFTKSPSHWNCPVCTFDNTASALNCEMCDGSRPAVVETVISEKQKQSQSATQAQKSVQSSFILWHYNGISNSKVDPARCVRVLISLVDSNVIGLNQGAIDEAGLREVIQTKWDSAVVDFDGKPPKIT